MSTFECGRIGCDFKSPKLHLVNKHRVVTHKRKDPESDKPLYKQYKITCQDTDIFIIEAIKESEFTTAQENVPKIQTLEEYIRSTDRRQGICTRNKYQRSATFTDINYLKKEYWKLHEFNRHYRCPYIKTNKTHNKVTEASGILRLDFQNKGYRMLIESGWYPGHGLGKNNQGIKYPIVYHKQTSRKGLGLRNQNS